MRIIAGQARGRRLAVPPKDRSIRPTADRLRESLFSILAARRSFASLHVLDLFAGTGALGCEALSRGAASATFVDPSRDAARLIQENLKIVALPGGRLLQAQAVQALRALKAPPLYDLVFLDPPYSRDLLAPPLALLDELPILAPGCVVVAEHHRDEAAPSLSRLVQTDARDYSDTRLTFWTLPDPQDDAP